MDNIILDHILKDTYTLSSLKHKVKVLKNYLISQIFISKEVFDLESNDLMWLKNLGDDFYKQFNQNNVYSIFEAIEANVSKIEPLYVYLPFAPDNQISNVIGQYIRANINRLLLYEAKFDANLVAGCAIAFRGVYRDYSLRSKIEEKKSEILENFKRYLR